jgi:hypothetical protein
MHSLRLLSPYFSNIFSSFKARKETLNKTVLRVVQGGTVACYWYRFVILLLNKTQNILASYLTAAVGLYLRSSMQYRGAWNLSSLGANRNTAHQISCFETRERTETDVHYFKPETNRSNLKIHHYSYAPSEFITELRNLKFKYQAGTFLSNIGEIYETTRHHIIEDCNF